MGQESLRETFHIVPGGGGQNWLYLIGSVVLAILLCVGWMVSRSLAGATDTTFVVSADGLEIRGDLYGRNLPLSRLRLDEARAVDLERETELKPQWKTMGTAVPGYRAGWFRLRNGSKALLYLTDPSRVAYVPTSEGYSLLLSVAEPERFVKALRSHAGSSRG